MKERTLTLLEKIRNLRNHHGLPVCFTLDAGPNVHLLYAPVARERVLEFISENISLLEGGRWIDDHVGNGPVPVEV
jgi:diphosphomevalonate decarboxylase